MVYDPTTFIACHDETEGPYGTTATWWRCSARAGIRGCWPSTFTKLHRHTTFDTKYSGVWMGNPQRVDEIVFSQSKQEEVVLEEEHTTWF